MQKYFTSILAGNIGYDLSQYNEEACTNTKGNDEQSETRRV